ncbi:MAG: hypothetical protein MI924_33935 [Chloroflexales bacterium]|nr:hypothetical protein [Chloroflexales bacterium]
MTRGITPVTFVKACIVFILFIASMLPLSATPTRATPAEATPPPSIRTICASTPVPAGWVVISVNHKAPGCAPAAQYVIMLVDDSKPLLSMCSVTPVPEGWTIVNVTKNAPGCAPFDRYIIRRG